MKTGIIIPCYNEADRLETQAFLDALNQNPEYHLCFVNDGSKDDTLVKLLEIQTMNPEQISVVNCVKNGGKAEAVRQGGLFLLKKQDISYIGFLDADLATDFKEYKRLTDTMYENNHKIVCGSRIKRLGADISRSLKRHLIGRGVATAISFILNMPFYDTQCGAKVFTKELAEMIFKKSFESPWLFDVEIFLRMKNHYGVNLATESICEMPLNRWVHVDGSKISWKEMYRTPVQLSQLFLKYTLMPKLKELQPAFGFNGQLATR
ncbi:MAG: glycosyltransferase family 2 protein [Bacteroidia bacterium]|nr:glycosyltransferase family 2 protein [Bacteroidia bacterium]